jgi:hypothetical protein
MVGHMSWGQRFEVVGYQAYDTVRGATLFGQVSSLFTSGMVLCVPGSALMRDSVCMCVWGGPYGMLKV